MDPRNGSPRIFAQRSSITFKGENYDYPGRCGGGDGSGLNLLRNFARAPMSISVLTIFALPNIFLALRSPGPSTATFSFPGGGTFIKTPVNSAVRRSREAPTTGRGLRFIQCYTQLRGQAWTENRERWTVFRHYATNTYLFFFFLFIENLKGKKFERQRNVWRCTKIDWSVGGKRMKRKNDYLMDIRLWFLF